MGRPQLGFPRLRVLPGKATALAIALDDTLPSPIPPLGILAGRRKVCGFGIGGNALIIKERMAPTQPLRSPADPIPDWETPSAGSLRGAFRILARYKQMLQEKRPITSV